MSLILYYTSTIKFIPLKNRKLLSREDIVYRIFTVLKRLWYILKITIHHLHKRYVGGVYKTLYTSYDYGDFGICFHLRDTAFTQSSLSAQVYYAHGMWACHFGDTTLC